MRARPAVLAAPLAAPLAVLTLLAGSVPASAVGGDDEDFVPPTVTVTLPDSDSGWFTGATAFDVKVTDAGGVSDVEYVLDGATTGEGVLRAGGGTVPVTAEGSTTIAVTATDRAGNVGVGTAVARLDRTAPTVTFGSELDGARVPVGADLRLDVTCADAFSGVESCTGPVAVGQALDTSTTGSRTVSVVARDHAGHSSTGTATYEVTTGTFAVSGALRVDGPLTTFSTATATLPTITPEPTEVSYQWYADWGAIPGATGATYDLPADAPSRLYVVAVAERAGYSTLTLTSELRWTQLSDWESHVVLADGTPRVGELLTAAVDATPVPDSIVYEWFADSAVVGRGPAYRVRPEDVGTTLVAQATIRRAGYVVRYPHTTVGVVTAATLEVTGTPAISGAPVVGRALSAVDPGVPAGATISRQWLVAGAAVTGATAATFRPRPVDAGRTVALRTTVTAPGHETWTGTSDPTAAVARATGSVRATAKVLGSKRGRTRTVRVSAVVSAAGVAPTGRVTITRGRKAVGTGTVDPRGLATITLRRQRAGTVRYAVAYAGDAGTLPASTELKVRIRDARPR